MFLPFYVTDVVIGHLLSTLSLSLSLSASLYIYIHKRKNSQIENFLIENSKNVLSVVEHQPSYILFTFSVFSYVLEKRANLYESR